MSRSVVLRKSVRCERCQLPPRWCVCAGFAAVETALQVDVLMHHLEQYRPSSTGHLIRRVIPGAGLHFYRREAPPPREALVRADRELWILHPHGETLPAERPAGPLQVLLIDGSWKQTTDMVHDVEGWGRRINLPMTGESRFWLRAQAGEGRFSTVEALMFLLAALGEREAEARLRVQFELHVYAGLRSRGHRELAENYLATSPVREALPEVLAAMHTPRPLEESRAHAARAPAGGRAGSVEGREPEPAR